MMKSKKLRLILTAAVFAVFAVYFYLNASQFKPLLHIDGWLLLVIALADFAIISANGLFIKFVLEPFNKFIGVAESIYVSLISAVGNFFAPTGTGFGFRAVYLKKKHGLPYSEFISTLSGNYIIVFLVNSFFALLSLYMLREHYSKQYLTLVVVFATIFIVSLILSVIKLPDISPERITKNKKLQKFVGMIFTITNGWNKVIANKKLMAKLIGVVIFNFLMTMLISKMEIAALHFTISFPALLLFSVLGSLSLFVNITPANLGVKEAIYIFSGAVIGFSVSQILLISLIDRGVYFVVLLVLWALSPRLQRKV
ncbi:MAG: lysylphosphatidylglycerol synthase transmembrane domain-containing protein [Candidatus Saccharimonadales bacterium]